MARLLGRFLLALCVAAGSATPAMAGTVQCNSTYHFCTFTGKLTSVRATDGGVLLFFDQSIPVTTMQNAGLNVTNGDAGLVMSNASDPNREAYKDKLFAAGMTSVASGKSVLVFLESGAGEFRYISSVQLLN